MAGLCLQQFVMVLNFDNGNNTNTKVIFKKITML